MRPSRTAGVALAGAVLIAAPALAAPVSDVQVRSVQLTAGEAVDDLLGHTTALIMGGSGVPIPPPIYVDAVNDLYLQCGPPLCTPLPLNTPEGLYPITGVKSLPLDPSVAQGAEILNQAIGQQLADNNDVTVFGWSQGAAVAAAEMRNLMNGSAGFHPDPDQLNFVLVGDPGNPNGGMLSRFDLPIGTHPYIPSLGVTFSGATPVTEFPTAIYTGEYDGFADFPRYPLNLASVLNALLGIVFVHTTYPTMTAEQIADAVLVPTSVGYGGATDYYMIPTENLPLLDPLRSIPVVGKLLADLVQPDLRVLVNLGYGDPEFGWVNANADVATPIGLFPSFSDLQKVPGLLVDGVGEGIRAVVHDLQSPAELFSLADNPLLNLAQNPVLAAIAAGFSTGPDTSGGVLGIVNAFSAAASHAYSALLPTADIANALLTTLPAYNLNIFLDELASGDLLDAIGLPIAATAGLVPVMGLFELAVVAEAAAFAATDLLSPLTDLAGLFL